MKITNEIVNKLIGLIDQGLCSGFGRFRHEGDFCVQQAVDKATVGGLTDKPQCVNWTVRSFGVACNDRLITDPKLRAKILKKFAVAELGSSIISGLQFEKLLIKKWNAKYPSNTIESAAPRCHTEVEPMVDLAVEVLTELKSPGTAYLYMCDPGAQLKPEHEEALKKEQEMGKRLTRWREYGAQSCTTKKVTNK